MPSLKWNMTAYFHCCMRLRVKAQIILPRDVLAFPRLFEYSCEVITGWSREEARVGTR